MSLGAILQLAVILFITATVRAQNPEPLQPPVVDPGHSNRPPSDAVVLFNGADLDNWTTRDGAPTNCRVEEAEMVCRSGDGDIMTRDTFGDAQIHVEFKVPLMPNETGQWRANSGVYVLGAWEVQILDSYENPTYPEGMLGAVYGFSAPLVNAARPPEQWQSYDIVVRMPRCDENGSLKKPGSMTVFLNGVLVQKNVRLDRLGPGHIDKTICAEGPLLFQDHSGFGGPMTEMRFRNIWIRSFKKETESREEQEPAMDEPQPFG